MNYNFNWDPQKALTNLQKHNITFVRAVSVFKDPLAISNFDNEHSEFEDRWITLGIDMVGVLLVIIHTFNEIDENNILIRIISARKATKNEISKYKE